MIESRDPLLIVQGDQADRHVFYDVVRKCFDPGKRGPGGPVALKKKEQRDAGKPNQKQNEPHDHGMPNIRPVSLFNGRHIKSDKDDIGRFIK